MPVPAQLISPRAGMKSSDILWYFMSKIIPCWIYTDRWNSLLEIAEMAFRDCGTYYSTVFNPLSEDFEPAVWGFWTSSLSILNKQSERTEQTVRLSRTYCSMACKRPFYGRILSFLELRTLSFIARSGFCIFTNDSVLVERTHLHTCLIRIIVKSFSACLFAVFLSDR